MPQAIRCAPGTQLTNIRRAASRAAAAVRPQARQPVACGPFNAASTRRALLQVPTSRTVRSRGVHSSQLVPELVPSDAQRRTIYALSTPPGKAGVAVLRISGPDALEVWHSMVRTPARRAGTRGVVSSPEPWRMYRCEVLHPASGELLDSGLAVYFRGTPQQAISTFCTFCPVFLMSMRAQPQAHDRTLAKTLSNCTCTLVAPLSRLSLMRWPCTRDVVLPSLGSSLGEHS